MKLKAWAAQQGLPYHEALTMAHAETMPVKYRRTAGGHFVVLEDDDGNPIPFTDIDKKEQAEKDPVTVMSDKLDRVILSIGLLLNEVQSIKDHIGLNGEESV